MKACYVCKVKHDADDVIPHPSRKIEPRGSALDRADTGVSVAATSAFPYTVTLYRGEDGVPVVEIDTDDEAQPLDHDGGAPYVRVYVNDANVYGHSPDCDVCGEPTVDCACNR